ncbi:hypothetical protein EVAR_16971_1 [Eumeta japonica]|uniref:Uncharacterized protein n=1 Tax=Eumeta variegata TaxID=151549 RepID=A0A4C1TVG9_EUMVA|nr:hypothetical protein EVAR_16971_1 [Eumeta japonica]
MTDCRITVADGVAIALELSIHLLLSQWTSERNTKSSSVTDTDFEVVQRTRWRPRAASGPAPTRARVSRHLTVCVSKKVCAEVLAGGARPEGP